MIQKPVVQSKHSLSKHMSGSLQATGNAPKAYSSHAAVDHILSQY